jgi:hypothetical protein
VEREGVWSEVECFGHGTGWHSLRSGLHEQAEYVEAVVLGESRQCGNGVNLFHISTNIEMLIKCQA